MSNQLAIATVTVALRETVRAAIQKDGTISSVSVRTVRPQNPPPAPEGPGLFIYLYQAMPNAALRSMDLPTRRGDGSAVQRPQLALNLYYLFSFFGDEATQVPQRLLGIVMRTLHSQPVITRAMMQAAMQEQYLAASGLENAVERVRLTPITLNLEDLSKLWSVYIQSPYLLSAAYEASVVLIEGVVTPEPSLPVRVSGLYNVLLQHPRIDSVEPLAGAAEPLTVGSLVRIRGSSLKGKITRVRLGDEEGEPSLASDSELAVALAEPPFAAGSLRAGIVPVRVVHYEAIGEEARLLPTAESNAGAMVFRPRFLDPPSVTGAPAVHVQVTPVVGPGQKVSLQMLPVPSGRSLNVDAPERSSDTSTLDIPIAGVPAGTYLVRLRVDGADSILESDDNPASPTYQQFIGPQVVVP